MNPITIKLQHRPTNPDQRLFCFLNFFHHMALKKSKNKTGAAIAETNVEHPALQSRQLNNHLDL